MIILMTLRVVLLCRYYTSNRLTERSDVYSFGIVLLELITGKRAIIKSYNKDNTNIVDWVSPLLARGDIRNIIDPRMPGNFDTNSVWKAIETTIACAINFHPKAKHEPCSD